ncbi:MAG: hypothetical protein HYV26_22070, partial [Candidatus Hydrogenedentes bacterium]|nr:hypothetical protein [Candidatus Hydrogenedentota bacterium]
FAPQLDQIVAEALAKVLGTLKSQSKALTGDFAPRSLATTSIPGFEGSVRARGLGHFQRTPAKYELTLSFNEYAAATGVDPLLLTGELQYNFVMDESVDPPVPYGLYRAGLTLGGAFGGDVDLHAVVRDGLRTGLRVDSGGDALELGEAPPDFLSFTSTLAGTGEAGHVDGPAATAQFDSPTGVAVAQNGDLFIVENDGGFLRKLTLGGAVSTLVEGLEDPHDVVVESESTVIISQWISSEAYIARVFTAGLLEGLLIPIVGEQGYSGPFPLCGIIGACDGRTPLATVPYPRGLDLQDNILYVAEEWTPPSVRAILPDGYVITLAEQDAMCGQSGTIDVARGNQGETYFVNPAPTCSGAIFVIEPEGQVDTIAGDPATTGTRDGIGAQAQFTRPAALVFDDRRFLYIADTGNNLLRRLDVTTGEVLRVAGCIAHAEGFDCNSQIGFTDGPADVAQFDSPSGIDMDRWGDLYIADERNHAIRFVRIIADPARAPVIDRFDPAVVRRGEEAKLVILGRNLALTNDIDLGPGIDVTIGQTGYNRAEARISVAGNAATGNRRLWLTTDYGSVTTPEDMALTVLADNSNGPFVETIAGTGASTPNGVNLGPAANVTFSFPGGLHALSADRVLVADPLENRIRLITTKTGAVEEIIQLITYSATGADVDILGSTLTALEGIGDLLETFGISDAWTNNAQDEIRRIAEQAVNAACDGFEDDCEWLSLPWAGTPFVPGQNNGFRLNATFWVPTDIWNAGSGRYYISDAANGLIRVVGYDPDKNEDAPFQVFDSDDQPGFPFSVTALDQNVFTTVPSDTVLTFLDLDSNVVNADWGGVPMSPGCSPTLGDGRQPIGIPLGTAAKSSIGGDSAIYVADPYCKTIWRVVNNNGQAEPEDIRSGDIPPSVIGPCVDGPASLATWGAPADVAVDQSGNIYVADCGCNSIRVIKDYGFGQDLDAVADGLAGFLAAHSGSLPVETVNAITQNLATLDTDFLDKNRFWVVTVAGSSAGEKGYRDGPAGQALFDAPTGVTVTPGLAETDERDATILFVTDTGNRRIRRIVLR